MNLRKVAHRIVVLAFSFSLLPPAPAQAMQPALPAAAYLLPPAQTPVATVEIDAGGFDQVQVQLTAGEQVRFANRAAEPVTLRQQAQLFLPVVQRPTIAAADAAPDAAPTPEASAPQPDVPGAPAANGFLNVVLAGGQEITHLFDAPGSYVIVAILGGQRFTLLLIVLAVDDANPTPTPTVTNTPLPPTATPTATPLPPTATPTATPTDMPLPPTSTPTATPTNTPLPPTVTPTATPTKTLLPPTTTSTATPTNTPLPPTVTPTATPTKTPLPPTATSTATPTNTSVPTGTPTATPIGNNLCGEVTQDTVLSYSSSPINVTCDVNVRAGTTLTIEAGVTLLFDAGSSLSVDGVIRSSGTAAQPILLTVLAGHGSWGGVYINDGGSALLEHVVIEYGMSGYPYANLTIASDDVVVRNSTIRHGAGDGVLISGASPTIVNTTIHNNGSHGVYMTNSSPVLTNNTYRDNGGWAVGVDDLVSLPDVNGADWTGNGYDGVGLDDISIAPDESIVWSAITGTTDVGLFGTVQVDGQLTLLPGAEWHFASGNLLLVSAGGHVAAQGTAAQPILLTSLAGHGSWGGVYINDGGSGLLEHVIIEYGGGYYTGANLLIVSDDVVVRNSTIRHSAGYGVMISGASPTIVNTTISNNNSHGVYMTNSSPVLTNNTYRDNGGWAVGVDDLVSHPDVSGADWTGNGYNGVGLDAIWVAPDENIVWSAITGTTDVGLFGTVQVDGQLTLPSGAEWHFASGDSLLVSAGGHIAAQGTATQPILLTVLAGHGSWGGVYIAAGGSALLEHVIIEYGSGYPYGTYANLIITSDDVVIRNSIIRHGAGYGVMISGASPTIVNTTISNNNSHGVYMTNSSPVLTNNTYRDNGGWAVGVDDLVSHPDVSGADWTGNGYNGVGLDAIWVAPDENIVWSAITGTTDVGLFGTVQVDGQLTLPSGAEWHFASGDSLLVSAGGHIAAQGTATQPILLTVLAGHGSWGGVYIYDGGSALLEHVVIEYGGGYYGLGYTGANLLIVSDDVVVRNSIIRYSHAHGITVESGSPSIADNSIYENTGFGVYNPDQTRRVNAEHNWWGSDTGPAPYGSGNSINYRDYTCGTPPATCRQYYVDADPWLGQQAAQSSQVADNQLPPNAPVPVTAPSTMTPGVPFITAAGSSSGSSFVNGYNTPVTYDVLVDWNGATTGNGTPGTVRFVLNGATTTVNGNATKTSLTYFVGPDLRPGKNTLRIVAVDAAGTSSSPVVLTAQVSDLPEGVDPADPGTADPTGDGIKYRIRFAVPDPPFEFEVDMTGFPLNQIPWLGGHKFGMPKSQTRFEATVRNNNTGSFKGQGRVAFHISDQEVFGTVTGEGDVTVRDNGDWNITKGILGVGLAGEIDGKKPVLEVIPAVANVTNKPVIGPLIKVVVDRLYFKGKFAPEVQASAAFANTNGLRLDSGQLAGSIRITLGLGLDAWTDKLEVEGYGGGRVKLVGAIPAPYLREATGEFLAGVKFKAFGMQTSVEKPWPWTYKPSGLSARTLTPIDGTEYLALTGDPYAPIIDDWQPSPRTYITKGYHRFASPSRSLGLQNARLTANQPTINQMLVSDIYPQANPSLAVHKDGQGNAMLVWVYDDPAKPIMRGEEIVFSLWNGNTWSAPAPITSDTYFDSSPQVAFDGSGHALVVWERINDPALPPDVTLDTNFTRKSELMYAVYDLLSGVWTAPAPLTTNSSLDYSARLAPDRDGGVQLAWLESPSGDLLPPAGAFQMVNTRRWNGSNWSAQTTAVQAEGLIAYSLAAFSAAEATIVIARDSDALVETSGDQELFAFRWNGATWGSTDRITIDAVDDFNPTVLYSNTGVRRLVWLKGEQLMLLEGDWSQPPTTTSITDSDALFLDSQVLADPDDNLTLLWQGQGAVGADIFYSVYDAGTQTWRLKDQLTNSQPLEKSMAPAYSANGELWIGYAQDEIVFEERVISPTLTISDVATFGRTDLYLLRHQSGFDLSVTDVDLEVSEPNPQPGSTVVVSASLHNTGDFAITNAAVAFYLGDPLNGGVQIGNTQLVTQPLIAGAAYTFTTEVLLPSVVQKYTVFAVADPADAIAERNEINNIARRELLFPDLQINDVLVAYYPEQVAYPLAVIANTGALTATDFLVQFWADSLTGTMLLSSTIPILSPGATTAVTIAVDMRAQPIGERKLFVVADPENQIAEVDENNNSDRTMLRALPDLTILAGDVTTATVGGNMQISVRVNNQGVAASGAFTVSVYAGDTVSDTNPVLWTTNVSGFAVGDAITVSGTITGQPNPFYAMVDPERTVAELNEANNAAVGQ
jgi:parallel beta-helix repeat protein